MHEVVGERASVQKTKMIHFIIAGCSGAISFGLCLLFLSVSRVPGWQYYRYAALIALASSFYGLFGLPLDWELFSVSLQKWFGGGNFVVAMLVPIAWFHFDKGMTGRQFHLLEKIAMSLLSYGALLTLIPGATVGRLQDVHSSWAELSYQVPVPSLFGKLLVFVVLLCFISVALRYTARALRGEENCWLLVLACFTFVFGAVEEGVVVIGWSRWPFLGAIGFTLSSFFLAVDLTSRITGNAQKLRAMNLRLEERIAESTDELIVAKQVLVATEKHSAMGSLVASVSHEINNPLAYICGNLQFVHDSMEEDGDFEKELEAAQDALQSVQEIQEVIADQRLFVRTPQDVGTANVTRSVDVAVRIVRPKTKFLMELRVECKELPDVAMDESRLIQVLVNILLNASNSSHGLQPIPCTTLRVFPRKEWVVIELQEQKSPSGLQRLLGDSTRRQESDQTLFICKGVVEACGGTLEVRSTNVGTLVVACIPVVQEKGLLPDSDGQGEMS